jgi:hypothetical protein
MAGMPNSPKASLVLHTPRRHRVLQHMALSYEARVRASAVGTDATSCSSTHGLKLQHTRLTPFCATSRVFVQDGVSVQSRSQPVGFQPVSFKSDH